MMKADKSERFSGCFGCNSAIGGQMMKYYDCVIIDSGVCTSHPQFANRRIEGLCIHYAENGEVEFNSIFEDHCGHGTAIYSIISHNVPEDTRIFNVKIFESDHDDDELLLIAALKYIDSNIFCRVINISCGVNVCNNRQELLEMCTKINDKGTYIIAAFDNNGAISYPAAFECVYGVDSSDECNKIKEFEFIEGSPINFRAKGGYQKVPWIGPEYAIVQGRSFSCAYMTSIILNILVSNSGISTYMLNKILMSKAKRVYKGKIEKISRNKCFSVKHALLFPFNKEIHGLLRFRDLLPFNIYGVSDMRITGHVGREISAALKYNKNDSFYDRRISDFDKIEWESTFDTIIVGHIKQLSDLTHRNLIDEVIHKCSIYNKNLICLDDISNKDLGCLVDKNCQVYFPDSTYLDFPVNRFGKLYMIKQPVVCVAGTSSSQGKFSLQLSLRRQLMSMGYMVGQLGTEPTALLFGMDEVFHYGYSVYNDESFERTVLYVNNLMHKISEKDPDIIIAGIQSGTVPYSYENISYLSNRQLEVLTGIMPDAVILCINPYDDTWFIRKTINVIENYLSAKVLCCVMYPMEYDNHFQTYNLKKMMDEKEQSLLMKKISDELGVSVYSLDDSEINLISEAIINYFGE